MPNFKNLATAEKRCVYISKRAKWWDKYVPNWLYRKLVKKTAWVDNYSWLTQDQSEQEYLDDLVIYDMWATSINNWCEKNRVDNAPYCVRKSCKEFLDKSFLKYQNLV